MDTGRAEAWADGGTVAGFSVRTDLALAYLRHGRLGDSIDIQIGDDDVGEPVEPPLRVWEPQPDNPFHARLWRSGSSAQVWIEGLGWYRIDTEGGTIEIPRSADAVRREERLWGIPTSLCVIARGDQTLHAASVEIDGRAVVFGAPGRHGKTTLAAAVHGAGLRLLSEDTTVFSLGTGPVAFPGPAMLRLRRDTYNRLGAVDAVVVGEDEDRVHLALDPVRRGDGAAIPIAGVVLLRREDAIRLERVDPDRAIPELWALAFKLPTDEDRARCFGAITALAGSVPVWNLARPLDWDSLDVVIETIRTLAGR